MARYVNKLHCIIGLSAVLLLLTLLLGSCSMEMPAPSSLIKRPKLSVDDRLAKEVILGKLPNSAELVRPLRPGDLSAVGFFDWDDERGKEVYAFYKNDINQRIGVIVLKRSDGTWKLVDSIDLPGGDVAYAKFIDLDGDGTKDVLLGTEGKEGIYHIVNAYVWSDGAYLEKWHDVFTELVIDDIDMDGEVEIVNVKLDRGSHSSLSVYSYVNDEIKMLAEAGLDMYINGYYNVVAGMLDKDLRGLVMDFKLGSKSASNAIVFKNDEIVPLIDPMMVGQEYYDTSKRGEVNSRDIDGDGIIEIAKTYVLRFFDEDDENYSGIYAWQKLLLAEGGVSFKPVALSYINPNGYYEFIFPKVWTQAALEGKLSATKSFKNHKRDFISFYYVGKEDKLGELFTIETFLPADYEVWKKREWNAGYEVLELFKTSNICIVAYYMPAYVGVVLEDKEKYNKLMLDESEIIEAFSVIK